MSGTTPAFGAEKLGVGRETAKKYLKDNPKLMDKIRKQVLEVVDRGEPPEAASAVSPSDAPDEAAPTA